jgi:hypothetical protein
VKPPNLRWADNCAECQHGNTEDMYYDEYRVTCQKHSYLTNRYQLCDDYEDFPEDKEDAV